VRTHGTRPPRSWLSRRHHPLRGRPRAGPSPSEHRAGPMQSLLRRLEARLVRLLPGSPRGAACASCSAIRARSMHRWSGAEHGHGRALLLAGPGMGGGLCGDPDAVSGGLRRDSVLVRAARVPGGAGADAGRSPLLLAGSGVGRVSIDVCRGANVSRRSGVGGRGMRPPLPCGDGGARGRYVRAGGPS